jgi:hypothetical protein
MAKDVKVLKLTTGEELISRMEESSDGFLILEEPRTLQTMAPTASGQDKITLDNKHVIVILEPKRDMENMYLSSVTGLTLQ